jgi:hypothetical protein
MKILKCNRTAFGVIAFILLLVLQIILEKTGHLVASFIPYLKIDPFDRFVEILMKTSIIN